MPKKKKTDLFSKLNEFALRAEGTPLGQVLKTPLATVVKGALKSAEGREAFQRVAGRAVEDLKVVVKGTLKNAEIELLEARLKTLRKTPKP